MAARLRHPCIVTVMGAVLHPEPLLVLEYMEHGVCVCVRVCVRARSFARSCVRACVCARVRVRACA